MAKRPGHYARYKKTYEKYRDRTHLLRIDSEVAALLQRSASTLGVPVKTVAEAVLGEALTNLSADPDLLWAWYRDIAEGRVNTGASVLGYPTGVSNE